MFETTTQQKGSRSLEAPGSCPLQATKKKNNESIASDGSVTSVTIDMNASHWLHMTWFLAALLAFSWNTCQWCFLQQPFKTVILLGFLWDSTIEVKFFLNMVRRKKQIAPKTRAAHTFFTPANYGIVAAIRWNILSC